MEAQNEQGRGYRVITKQIRYKDEKGNTYSVEQSVRNRKWVVIRTNEGGNRKAAKQFCVQNKQDQAQIMLDREAFSAGWTEVRG